MLSETWEHQYRRMHRQYELLQRTADQNKYDEIQQADRARDILYHFCCDAFHLRDWITNADQTLKDARKAALNAFLPKNDQNPRALALAKCADIANGFKHGGLDQGFYTPGGPAEIVEHVQGVTFPKTFPANFSANHWKIRAIVSGVEDDALDVARDAVAEWDWWLPNNGLWVPSL
ncbi:hypothetical protein [Mycobacterium sp. 94-17]|uniref:hypothetical protein n=1 Tax=Mycobacterium sp. 94-17 TaxID=2986147 RepID=UPI002D1F5D1D|nr:hypothetical protein [Mycobacterium sp. 94-17]MEB4211729.1 hypothetical protein [Mycobacterium sp. 94-17]